MITVSPKEDMNESIKFRGISFDSDTEKQTLILLAAVEE